MSVVVRENLIPHSIHAGGDTAVVRMVGNVVPMLYATDYPADPEERVVLLRIFPDQFETVVSLIGQWAEVEHDGNLLVSVRARERSALKAR